MRLVLSYVVLLCFAPFLLATDTGPAMPDISRGWKFSPGDDAGWSDPAIDHTQWQSISVGIPWERQGYAGHDGFGWYRLHVRIPSELREHPDFKQFGYLRLKLGKIDDVDQTWWNGQLIGATGQMPDSYSTRWSTKRIYRVPARLIRWDAENVIAVRVYDGGNEGGMVEGPYGLRIASWQDLVEIKFGMGRGDGIFLEPTGLPISVSIHNEMSQPLAGRVQWLIETDEGEPLNAESIEVTLPPSDKQHLECAFSPAKPGFYRAKCTFQRQEAAEGVTESRILGYRPEEVQTALTREDDFDQFWKQTLDELASVEPQYELTLKPERATASHDVFEVSMRSLDGVRVGGWYERPKAVGPHPALLRLPGYTEALWPTGTSDPLAVFSLNIRGHGNSQKDINGKPANFWIRGLDDKHGYFYQGAYADCVRAVDFLASREEIDVSRIAVTGGSQGGGLSLVTAALDERIRLCAPDIPFLCDWVRYFKTSSWPEMDAWIEAQPHRSWEKTLRTMSYFDALNFTDRIRCPVFLGLGLQDDVCPPVTIFAVYNRLTAAKEYRIYPKAGHWVEAPHDKERRQWIVRHFAMSPSD
jgi:cephalosporin-C deacetylase-like acetyl esterase